jgi:hypothetical protein
MHMDPFIILIFDLAPYVATNQMHFMAHANKGIGDLFNTNVPWIIGIPYHADFHNFSRNLWL